MNASVVSVLVVAALCGLYGCLILYMHWSALYSVRRVKPGMYKVLSGHFHEFRAREANSKFGANHEYMWLQQYREVCHFPSKNGGTSYVIKLVGKPFCAAVPSEFPVGTLIAVQINNGSYTAGEVLGPFKSIIMQDTGDEITKQNLERSQDGTAGPLEQVG